MKYSEVYALSIWKVYLAKNKYDEEYIGCTTDLDKVERSLLTGTYIKNQNLGFRSDVFELKKSYFVGSFLEANKFKRWLCSIINPIDYINRVGLLNFRKNILYKMEDSRIEINIREQFFLPDKI